MLWNLNKRPLSRLCKDPFSFNSFPYVYNHYVLEYTGVASQGLVVLLLPYELSPNYGCYLVTKNQ